MFEICSKITRVVFQAAAAMRNVGIAELGFLSDGNKRSLIRYTNFS